MRANDAGRRRPILDLYSDQPLRRPNHHVVRDSLTLAVGVAIFEFRMHLDRSRLVRYVADVGARAAGVVKRKILSLMHAGILFGLHPFRKSFAVDDSRLHVAVGENVVIEIGELWRRVLVDLASKRNWESFCGTAGEIFGA